MPRAAFSVTFKRIPIVACRWERSRIIRILFLGELVGKAGVFCIKTALEQLKKKYNIDFVIANADGTTGGFGIGKNHSIYLRKLGINVLTGGDQIFFKKDMVSHIEHASYILRPVNFPQGTPGRGWRYYKYGNEKIAVISVLGLSGYNRLHLRNPFNYLPELVSRIKEQTPYIVIDYHALASAEKYSLFYHMDGTVSAIVGTGTRAVTADAQVLPRGTAVICDAGRCGSINSISGLDVEIELGKFLKQVPERSKDAWEGLEIQGACIEVSADGKASSIEHIRFPCAQESQDAPRSKSTAPQTS